MSIDQVRAIADAVLYEGYLLYPYRASSRKNQSRWQFGVLGPPRAGPESYAEEPRMSMQCLVRPHGPTATVTVRLRFLQVQTRSVERRNAEGFVAVGELWVDDRQLLSWEEAVEQEVELPAWALAEEGSAPHETRVEISADEDVEAVHDVAGEEVARIVRRRRALSAVVRREMVELEDHLRLGITVENTHPDRVDDKETASRVSLVGAHLLVGATDAGFVSLLEPPPDAVEQAAGCRQHRCWPVLAGAPGSTDVLLGSPIILYDHPEIAEQSQGALFDSTEIDEILTLRVMTMTEAEKAEARATDPRAAEIIRRCDEMEPGALQQLHGVLRNPHGADPHDVPAEPAQSDPFATSDAPWWDPASDASVAPETDTVTIQGVPVAKGSLVRVHPSRRADAQDLFFADQVARVTAVLSDVDGETHVALVLVDDPAADLHDWYGRYLYFSPDELEPLDPAHREESPA